MSHRENVFDGQLWIAFIFLVHDTLLHRNSGMVSLIEMKNISFRMWERNGEMVWPNLEIAKNSQGHKQRPWGILGGLRCKDLI